MNYNMNKLNLTPTQLMHELESAEESLVKPASVHLAEVLLNPKGNLRVVTRTRKKRQ